MGVGDHGSRRGHPAAALHAQATRRAQHLYDAAPRAPHVRIARDLRVGRRHVRLGPVDLGEGVEARQGLDERSRGRQRGVELTEDLRALDRLAQLARPGGVERHRAAHPGQQQAQAAHQQGARSPSSRPRRSPEPAAQAKAEQLEEGRPGCRPRGSPRRAPTAARRATRRPRPAPAARAGSRGRRPAGEAGEREGADDQTLGVAPGGHEHREGDDDPVEGGHGRG